MKSYSAERERQQQQRPRQRRCSPRHFEQQGRLRLQTMVQGMPLLQRLAGLKNPIEVSSVLVVNAACMRRRKRANQSQAIKGANKPLWRISPFQLYVFLGAKCIDKRLAKVKVGQLAFLILSLTLADIR